jgi:integrase
MKLPKFVHGFIDRHGRARFYFRRKGYERVKLDGLPWSPSFMAAYAEALAGQRAIQPGRGRIKPGTMRALALSYFATPGFAELKPSSQREYRLAIERFCNRRDAGGMSYGDKLAEDLQRKAVIKLIAAQSHHTRSANFLLAMLRILMAHAIDLDWRADNPAKDVRPLKVKSDGFHSWTEEEIAHFRRAHPIGSQARLALELLLNTGQRGRSDVIRMGRQHIEDGMIRVRQQKTGTELSLPITAELAEAIAAAPPGMTFLTTTHGAPWSPSGFGNWFREQCRIAGLPRHCRAHGLRKACARRLADAGCTEHEIRAVTGHAGLREVQGYTRGANQKKLALAAVAKLKAST